MENDIILQPAETTRCGSCYMKVNDSDAFCDNCGYPLKGSESEQQSFINNRSIKEIDLEDYNKKIKTAGTTLYWIAGVCALSGVVLYGTSKDESLKTANLIIYLILTMVFIILASWSRRKPLAAIISGASLYAIILIKRYRQPIIYC